ncbi:MAG: hypothetical protein JRJ87_15860 [Deltaproteobacteria bacterium]|nr:hypothetical protein [Deltaproteobacteria bacterium]
MKYPALIIILLLSLGLPILPGCSGASSSNPDAGSDLPDKLPFTLTRPDVGQPLSQAEISAVTVRITGFWKQIDYFTWVYETCHGMDISTGYPDYLIWWHDVDAVKLGDTVTFRNNSAYGGSHNNADPTASVLIQAIGGYLLTGDQAMGMLVEQFAKSITATMQGFVFDESDPLEFIMARNIVTHNHTFVLPSGKKKAVDYTDWYTTYEGWNANRVHYPNNPTWGDIYVTTMRSKDDVPYMYRAAAWFPYLIEYAPDQPVREAAAEALAYMQGFAKDIVDSGYYIRSKDEEGQVYIPDQDLASFNDYIEIFPDAECDPRLASALLAYAEPLDIDCGSGQGSGYDMVAGQGHYFNYSIIDVFHLSALQLALTSGHARIAEDLLLGYITRLERYRDPDGGEPGWDHEDWERDIALLLLHGASLGMPLTSEEARQVHKFLDQSVSEYEDFPNWNLWDPSVPDGTYSFRDGFHPAHRAAAFRIEDIAYLLEYCWSPFKNPAGVEFVDCEIVRNPARWGLD